MIPGGTENLIKIVNNNSKNNKKILILGNSFVKAVVPFLSVVAEKIDIID